MAGRAYSTDIVPVTVAFTARSIAVCEFLRAVLHTGGYNRVGAMAEEDKARRRTSSVSFATRAWKCGIVATVFV